MAAGKVVVNGRFSPGTHVQLVKVASERVLRPEAGAAVASAQVDEHGNVSFSEGVQVGARYFAVGTIDGHPVEVRARGEAAEDVAPTQPAVQPDRRRVVNPVGGASTLQATTRLQHEMPPGTPQRSDTRSGVATPIDPPG